ncbi:MAG: nuclear transport factor 2 family protein [Actinomycetota bacterium]|nr:nuclear transport factor 2 family protein [Actinomycetota bacterium]
MFTEDAIWEGANRYAEFGITKGRDAIRDMFSGTPDQLPLTVHWLTNAVVTVADDRETATGKWEVIQAATFGQSDTQVWVSARYDNEFRRGPDGWLIAHLRYADVFVTPVEDGWNVTRYVSPFTGERLPA